MDDTQLLRDYVANGSENAFRELVDRHINLVYGAALRRLDGDAHGAADVAQAVFEILARKASSLACHPTLAGWLFATTHFIAARTRRDEQRRRMWEQEAQLMNEMMSDSEAEPHWAELRPVLEDAILELEPRDREAVVLRYFEGRPFAEIGAQVRLSEDAARKRVDRALERLERLLAKQGITSTAGALALALSNQPLVAAPAGMAAAIAGQALAGATLTAKGVGAGIGTFMFTSKTGIGIAAAVLLAVGAAFYEANEARSARRDLARAAEDRDAMAAVLRRGAERTLKAEARAQAAETALQAARATAASQPSGPSAARSAVTANPAATPGPSMLDRVNADPNYQRAQSNYHRATLRLDFGPLYHKLGLSPEKMTGLEDALVEQAAAMTEVRLAAVAQGIAPSDPALVSLGRPVIADTVKKIRQLLGPDGFQAYEEHTRVIRARAILVDALAGNLYYTNTPLTATQADQMLGIIGANTTKYAMSGLVAKGNETDWPKVLSQAQAYLSPPQIETLRALQRKAEALKILQDVTAKVQATPTASPVANRATPPGAGGG